MWTKPLPGLRNSSFKALRSMRNRPRIIARRFRRPTTTLLRPRNAAIPRGRLLSNCSVLQAHAEAPPTPAFTENQLDLNHSQGINSPMPTLNRRQFIRTGGAALAAAALTARLQAGYTKLKIGEPDCNLKLEAKPASIELAKSIGFDGVQISLGHSSDSKNPPAHLPVSTPDLFDQFVTEARKNQLPIASTCVEILHRNYLKNDPLGK